MRRVRFTTMVVLLLTASIHAPVHAQEDEAPSDAGPQTAVRTVKAHVDIEIQPDGSYTTVSERILTPLTEQAVKGLGQASLSFREDVSTLDILEAYTLKQDGRRVDVAADRIKVTSPQYAARAPIFNTVKSKVVIFPDVAVGDRLVVKTRMHMHTPDFPGQFNFSTLFPRSRLYDDVRVAVKSPQSMPLKFEARGLTEVPDEKSGDTVRRVWTFANSQVIPEEQGAVDPWDREPRLLVSTYANWAAVAQAYESRAKPMAMVATSVQRMADEITAGVTNRREQAKALYDWVSLNIRYVGVYLGAGGFVPHSADSVLANRYGDCKDHVTLLEALLAAKGIESSTVLIHTAPRFEEPGIPTLSAFNHAITWLPEFNVYLDSTARFLSFGVLANSEVDKPVLHTRDGSTLRRTPVDAEGRSVVNKLQMTVANDGSVTGVVTVTGTGAIAATLRSQMSAVDTAEARPRYLQAMLNSAGLVGSAELTRDDATKLTDSYKYSISFQAKDWLRTDASGAFVVPTGFFSSVRMAGSLAMLSRPVEKVNHTCGSVTLEEHAELTLPGTIKPGKLPKDVLFDDPVIQYTATYSMEGSTIRAARRLTTKAKRGSCPPQEMAVYRRMAEEMRKDLRAQIVYEAS